MQDQKSRRRNRRLSLRQFGALAVLTTACAGPSRPAPTPVVAAPPPGAVEVTIVGTNDLHGHVEALPVLGGYLQILRQRSHVVLIDAGDMFQGTLLSNQEEGAPVVEAYNLLGYAAATIGNHEFDFGPVGPDATVRRDGQDPRGALKARAAEANFPFLAANIFEDESQGRFDPTNVLPSVLHKVGAVDVGIIGVTTIDTPKLTLPANVLGLTISPLANAIAQEATELRNKGAEVIIVAAHAGGVCTEFADADDLSSCDDDQEIFQVAKALPPNTVDVIVAGHTHKGVAHRVNDIAIIESYAKGAAFGRVDLTVQANGEVIVDAVHPPRFVCESAKAERCEPGVYEGVAVTPDPTLQKLAVRLERASETLRSRSLAVNIKHPIRGARGEPSPLGNLFADLMLASQPQGDVAITNGGGLRADLPVGTLTYGALFEAMPFDNRFALIKLTGANLRTIITRNIQGDHGILSIAGMRAKATCEGNILSVTVVRKNGKKLKDDEVITLVTSDFLASGGDGLMDDLTVEQITYDDTILIRDALAKKLAAMESLDVADKSFFDPKKPRLAFPGPRPVRCR